MKRVLIIIFLAFLSLIWIRGIAPGTGMSLVNPAIIVGVFLFIRNYSTSALIWMLSCGLLLDTYSASPFGTHTLSLVSSLIAIELALQYYDQRDVIRLLLACTAATVAYYVFYYGITTFSAIINDQSIFSLSQDLVFAVVSEILVTTIAVIVIRTFATRVFKMGPAGIRV